MLLTRAEVQREIEQLEVALKQMEEYRRADEYDGGTTKSAGHLGLVRGCGVMRVFREAKARDGRSRHWHVMWFYMPDTHGNHLLRIDYETGDRYTVAASITHVPGYLADGQWEELTDMFIDEGL